MYITSVQTKEFRPGAGGRWAARGGGRGEQGAGGPGRGRLQNHVGLGSVRSCPVLDAVFPPGFGEGDLGVFPVASRAERSRTRDGILSGDRVPVLLLRLLFFFFPL